MESVDEIYMAIANHCIEQIDDKWSAIRIETEFFETAAEFDIYYVNEFDEKIDLSAGYKLFKLYKELYAITTVNKNNKWNRSVFTLEPTGKFNIDFEWDPLLADEIERLSKE